MADSDAQPVVYEVRLTVTPAVEADFDDWLAAHVGRMLAFDGFYDARIIRPEATPDGRQRRIVRYHLRDRGVLDDYLEHHAADMRAEGVERFGEALEAERDVYPALPEDHSGNRCPNCGTPAPGQFCPACGQEQKDIHRSFWRLMHDFLGDTFTFDSRLVRSLRPLVARPGFLTREYLDGRRARYIPPLRVYLFISFVFFAVFKLALGSVDVSGGVVLDLGKQAGPPIDLSTGIPIPREPEGRAPGKQAPSPTSRPETEFGKRIKEKSERLKANPRLFLDRLLGNAPVAVFLLMPFYALVLRLLYPLAGYVYLEHLIFALHMHAFTFLMLLVAWPLFYWVPRYVPSAELNWFAWVLGTYMLVYPWIAMRRVYRQGIAMTTFKYLMQAFIYFALLLTTLVLELLATAYWF